MKKIIEMMFFLIGSLSLSAASISADLPENMQKISKQHYILHLSYISPAFKKESYIELIEGVPISIPITDKLAERYKVVNGMIIATQDINTTLDENNERYGLSLVLKFNENKEAVNMLDLNASMAFVTLEDLANYYEKRNGNIILTKDSSEIKNEIIKTEFNKTIRLDQEVVLAKWDAENDSRTSKDTKQYVLKAVIHQFNDRKDQK